MKALSNLRSTLNAKIISALVWFCERLPAAPRYGFAWLVGWLFGLWPGGMKQSLQRNLNLLFPDLEKRVRRISQHVFANFSVTLCDFFVPKDLEVDVPSRKILEDLRAQKKGVLVLTFHMGHWELGARVMQQWGWPVTAVYQPYQNKAFKKLIESHRAPGVNFLAVGGNAANGVRDALRRGDMVAMLGDHPFGEDGTEVDLLGHRIMWPKGPVLLAVREKAPIVVAVVLRSKLGNYTAHVEEPLFPVASTRAEVDRLVQRVAEKFGQFAARYPEQWYRFRPFEMPSPN